MRDGPYRQIIIDHMTRTTTVANDDDDADDEDDVTSRAWMTDDDEGGGGRRRGWWYRETARVVEAKTRVWRGAGARELMTTTGASTREGMAWDVVGACV